VGDTALRVLLPLYCLVFGFVCLFWRTLRFHKTYAKNPIVLGSAGTPHGFLARLSSLLSPAIGAVTMLFAISPRTYVAWLRPFSWYGSPGARLLGLGTLLVALLLAALGQSQMGPSWRVGIETDEKTIIVRRGLYRYSRNPIYLGMILIAIGYFLILPDPLTLVLLAEACTLFSVQVRLEEQHLRALHGADFDAYCREVPRWLLW
jgi:protein-S-isoprenylcysteine O-methyltransferase Ste14